MSPTLRRAMRLALPALLALPATTMAQSGVTLYGVIDTALTYQTNSNPAGDAQIGLQQGGEGFLSGSRFGLRGVEDLGGGVKAGFVLENGLLAEHWDQLDMAGMFHQLGVDFYAMQGA